MPIDLEANRAETAEFTVIYGGDNVTVTYLPYAMTAAWARELQHTPEADFDEQSRLMAEVVVDWDVFENGRKLVIDAESFLKLPSVLLNLIGEGLIKAAQERGRLAQGRQRNLFERMLGAAEPGRTAEGGR